MRPGRPLAAVVLAGALLAGCGDGYGSVPAAGTEPSAGAPVQEPLSASPDDPASQPTVGPDAFAFAAPAVGGGQVEGAELAGRDVALWFWAPWCPNCNREAPGVAELAREFDGRVRVLGIAGRGELAAMEAFVAEHDLAHVTSVADVDGAVWQRFGVIGQPTWIFVDGDTGTATQHLGYLPDADLGERLRTLAG